MPRKGAIQGQNKHQSDPNSLGGIIELRRVTDLRAMSQDHRRELIENIFIEYPRLSQIIQKVRECHEEGVLIRRCSMEEPPCMFIAGWTHAGKSNLIKSYMSPFNRSDDGERTIIKILPITLPSSARPKNVASALLKAIGDPNFHRGTIASMTSRVVDFFRECQVELLVLDEFHHIIDRTTDKVLTDASEWLKTLIIESRVPVVAMGMPTASAVLDYNEQLSRRFPWRYEITSFRWNLHDSKSLIEFRSFLKAIDLRLPLAEPTKLASVDWAHRIHYATDGVVGYVMKLVKRAAVLALKEGSESVRLEHLSDAFQENIKTVKRKKENPFASEEITFERVTQWIMAEREVEKEEQVAREKKPPVSKRLTSSQVLRAK